MARVMKHQKLVNPAKRKLSLAQKLHFGTKRVREAAKRMLSGKGKRRRKASSHRRRVSNPIGTIITLGANPGKVGSMTKRRRNTSKRRVARRNPTRRHRNPVTHAPARRHARRRTHTYVARRRHVSRSHRHRVGNPSFTGAGTKVMSIIGGAALTKLAVNVLPAFLQTGFLKYISTGVLAWGLGWGTGKVFKSPAIGENVMAGGLVLLGLQVLADLVPGLAAYSGLSVGNLITPSSFYTPQVPVGNSMTSFVVPSAIPSMVAAPVKGLKGMGRLAVSRSGY